MICESELSENDIIQRLLKADYLESTLQSDKFSWYTGEQLDHEHCDGSSSTVPKSKHHSRSNGQSRHVNNSYRYYFGYKPNKLMKNNYQFRFLPDAKHYVEFYRKENKAVSCLSCQFETNFMAKGNLNQKPPKFVNLNSEEGKDSGNIKEAEVCQDVVAGGKRQQEVPEKSLVNQVKFWKTQNISSTSPPSELSDLVLMDSQRPPVLNQSKSTYLTSNGTSTRSVRNRRTMDVYVPQGTTYDILSEESRLNNNNNNNNYPDSNDKLKSLQTKSLSRENSNIKKRFSYQGNCMLGGTLEFAKMLDEKLRMLYEQRLFYAPAQQIEQSGLQQNYHNNNNNTSTTNTNTTSNNNNNNNNNNINKSSSESKLNSKSNQRISSASNRSRTLNTLSVSGTSTGRLKGFSKADIANSKRTPCLLPQMPAFGTHYLPRFIFNSNNICTSDE